MSRILLVIVVTLLLLTVGCSKVVQSLDQVRTDNKKSYEKAKTLPDLEIPPGLSTEAINDRMVVPEGGEVARYSTYQDRNSLSSDIESASQNENRAIKLLDNEHSLTLSSSLISGWPMLKNFMVGEGYTLELDDVELGIMETAWNFGSKIKREKIKIFGEDGLDSATLFIALETEELESQGDDLEWRRQPRKVQSEREFVDKLFTYIRPESDLDSEESVLLENGANDSTAAPRVVNTVLTPTPRETDVSQLINVGAGKIYLALSQSYDASWKTIGVALENAEIKVKSADKSRGIYVISRNHRIGSDQKKSGVWRKMKFWKKDKQRELQVSLTGVTDKTEVVVLDSSGRWVTGSESDNLLQMLHDSVNRSRR
ncbi:MAG: outer membrane protein assembly factor BamC [Proteobacteria bacterium]|nr:outer membrane protein assembly factor BamC [Pseudomonadota bacterium]MBT7625874.1 outer membrane protein assembly factor BamC [Pseudomonadota bacterium]